MPGAMLPFSLTARTGTRMKRIKAIGKKVVRNFVVPPWESDIMEFKHGLWQGVSPLFTQSGRQLGEENTRPFLFNDRIPAKTIACKYDGSRHGRLINMSALRTAMINYDKAIDITRAVIQRHAATASSNKPAACGGIWDLYIISLASIALISYSVRKNPKVNSTGIVPDDLASQYQFIAGIFMICRHMIDGNDALISENTPINAVQLYEYADQHEIFMSFNGMVCAGSTKKIMDFLEFCTNRMSDAFSGTDDAQEAGSFTPLPGITDDVDDWFRYVLLAVEFDCFVKMARRTHRIETGISARTDHENSFNTYKNISDYCVSLMSPCDVTADVGYESGALMRQNKILGVLNRKPLTKIDKRILTEQLHYD